MGLDANCNGVSIKCGSYSFMEKIRENLIFSLKDYLELDSECEIKNKDDLIDILVQSLTPNSTISYENLNETLYKRLFWPHELDGFFPFLTIEDHGYMTPFEAERFLDTFEKVKDYIHGSLQDFDGEFVYQCVFQESVDAQENITFF